MREAVDLLVIGGGINGAGIARDAAGRGLSVLLCEKGDLAEGTSSRSSKLIHGGLRYLEYYEFRLVREALIEREVLLRAAPHIVWPLRFVLPHSPEQRPAWLIRTGLFLYDHLGGRRRLPGTRRLDLRRAPEGVPIRDGFRIGFEYSDCWVEDSRLVVLSALDAAAHGAEILVRTAAVSARREADAWRVALRDEAGAERRVQARALVNAAGPWAGQVIGGVIGADSTYRVRLVKGSHVIVRKFWDGPQAYILQNDDRRVIFVIPYAGDLALIGTTDIPYDGRPEDVAANAEECEYLLRAVNRVMRTGLSAANILHVYSGVRPLHDDASANPSAVTRDYVFDVSGEPPGTVGLRREDHDLPQACRARAGPAAADFPADGGGLDRSRDAARRRHARGRFRCLPAPAAGAGGVPAGRSGAPLCAALWHPSAGAARACARDG